MYFPFYYNLHFCADDVIKLTTILSRQQTFQSKPAIYFLIFVWEHSCEITRISLKFCRFCLPTLGTQSCEDNPLEHRPYNDN